MEHFNLSHGAATEHRVHGPQLVESIAKAALRKVPGSRALLQKHFPKGESFPRRPAQIKPQLYYSGYGTK